MEKITSVNITIVPDSVLSLHVAVQSRPRSNKRREIIVHWGAGLGELSHYSSAPIINVQ